jgi:anti-sigma B factor antagonist
VRTVRACTPTEVKLVEIPKFRSLVVLGYPDIAAAADVVPLVVRHQPLACEGLDDVVISLEREEHLGGAALDKLPGAPPLTGRPSGPEVAQAPEIGFPVEVVEGVPVVTAPEEVDIANVAGLRAAVSEAVGAGSALVIVDMSRTRFCDSAGLNVLVTADRQARAEGGEVRLVIVAAAIVRVVALTGVDRVIPVYASLEEALS